MTFPVYSPADNVRFVEIAVSGTTSNVYLVGSGPDILIVDAGSALTADKLVETLVQAGCAAGNVKGIVVSHAHCDHYGGAARLAEWSGAGVWAHVAAVPVLEDPLCAFGTSDWAGNAGADDMDRFVKESGPAVWVSRALRDGDRIELGGIRLEALHTPGHEWGSIALFDAERRHVFCGDLVQGGIDSSANWLGLLTDISCQRRSLERLRGLKADWLFKGHRAPLSGADVEKTIAAGEQRLRDLEAAVYEALRGKSAITTADAARSAFRRVLGMDISEIPPYAFVTMNAVLLDMARRGLVSRDGDRNWVGIFR